MTSGVRKNLHRAPNKTESSRFVFGSKISEEYLKLRVLEVAVTHIC